MLCVLPQSVDLADMSRLLESPCRKPLGSNSADQQPAYVRGTPYIRDLWSPQKSQGIGYGSVHDTAAPLGGSARKRSSRVPFRLPSGRQPLPSSESPSNPSCGVPHFVISPILPSLPHFSAGLIATVEPIISDGRICGPPLNRM